MARSALLRLARSQPNQFYSRTFQSGYHLSEPPTWPNVEGSRTSFNSSSQFADFQKRWFFQTSSRKDEDDSSPGYHFGRLLTSPFSQGANTLPNSASHIAGIQKRWFSHTPSSENVSKIGSLENQRPSIGLKPVGTFSFTDALNCHNKALLEKSRPYHSVSAGTEGGQNAATVKTLRPLSPHLAVYQPLVNSMTSIFNRISAVVLVLALFVPLLWLNIASIGFTYSNFYLLSYYSSNLLVISAEITALAFVYHTYQGFRHIIADFSGKLSITKK